MKKYLFLLLICFNLSASEWDCENCYDYGFKFGLTYSNVDSDQFDSTYNLGFGGGFSIVSYINENFSFQTEFILNNTNFEITKIKYKEDYRYDFGDIKKEVYSSIDLNIPFIINFRVSSFFRIYVGLYMDIVLYNELAEVYSNIFSIDIGGITGISINVNNLLIDFRYSKGFIDEVFTENHYYNDDEYELYLYRDKFSLLLGIMF